MRKSLPAVRDGRLFSEGCEEYIKAECVLVRHTYMGVFEFSPDGLITDWRDYFQTNDPNAGKLAALPARHGDYDA